MPAVELSHFETIFLSLALAWYGIMSLSLALMVGLYGR